MMDYKELKEQIVELNETIDKLGKEATSFEAKKAALDEAAKSLKVLADNMSNVVGNVEMILKEVEKVTVDKTLSAMQTSANDIINGCGKYERQTANTLDQVVKTSQDIAVSNKDLMNTTNALIESNNNAIEAISKKATMLGTIAIICSIAALAMSFLKR